MSIAKGGYPFIGCFFAAGIICFLIGKTVAGIVFFPLAVICFLLTLFCLYFFRDPKIAVTEGENNILSPCNGTVLEVIENENGMAVIRVFLSVFDVHLQRTPVAGTVKKIEHKPGKFLKAYEPDAHIVNEQNCITIENEKGIFVVKQIAGAIARRCVAWVKEGDVLKKGDKIGMIKFSSQVDLIMPCGYKIKVKKGDKVVSGITVFAEI